MASWLGASRLLGGDFVGGEMTGYANRDSDCTGKGQTQGSVGSYRV